MIVHARVLLPPIVEGLLVYGPDGVPVFEQRTDQVPTDEATRACYHDQITTHATHSAAQGYPAKRLQCQKRLFYHACKANHGPDIGFGPRLLIGFVDRLGIVTLTGKLGGRGR